MELFEFNLDSLVTDQEPKEEPKVEPQVDIEDTPEEPIEEPVVEPEEPETTVEPDVEEETPEVDNNLVTETFNILRDFLPLEEAENLDEEVLRQQLTQDVPQKLFMSYVGTRPSIVQDLLTYGINLTEENATEKLVEYFQKYHQPQTQSFDLDTPEGARQFLMQNEEFKEPFLGDEEDMNILLDQWEDADKLISKAKSYQENSEKRKAKAKEAERLQAEQLTAEQQNREQLFRKQIQEEIKSTPWSESLKQKTIGALNPQNIQQVNEQIRQSPKAIVQLANLYTYFQDGNFDQLFELLEGKKQSSKIKQTKASMQQDALARRLNKTSAQPSTKVKGFVPQLQ